MYECATCDEEFYSQVRCDDHMTDYGHWIKCQTCTRCFRSRAACNQHMNNLDHWAPQYDCETCDRRFTTKRAADQHMAAVGHWANFCKPCDRHFSSAHNFRAHMNSRTHRGQEISCPFCQKGFVTASGASHHLERGACPNAPQMNRATIHRMIRRLDPHGTVTKKQLEWHPEDSAVYQATSQAYNGRFWECYLCHRNFNTSQALNQHLSSPAHQQNIYHCLNRRTPCRKEFKTLAALFNHLESESCDFMRFEDVQNVQRQVTDAIRGGRLLTGF